MTQLQQLGEFLGRKLKQQQVDFNDFKVVTEANFAEYHQIAMDWDVQNLAEAKSYADQTKQDANSYTDLLIGNLQETVSLNHKQLSEDIASEHSMMLTGVEEAKQDAKSYTDAAIANLVDSAPETMNTLHELADAIEANETLLEAIQKVTNNHTHVNATKTVAGFMSAEDKTAFDNIGTYDQLVAAFNTVVGSSSPLYEATETDPGAGTVVL